MLNKKLAIILTLALCIMPLYTPLVLAETAADQSTVVENLETDPGTETTEVSVPNPDDVVSTDTEVTDGTDGSTEPENTTETDAGEIPDSSEASDEDLPPVLDENGEVVEPGTLPDSPFYWLTTLIEKLQVALTFDPEEKTELLEEQALERMAEAGALIEKGDTEHAEGALTAYSGKIEQAQAFLASLTETDSEVTQKLETALSQRHANNIQTLGGLLDKLPPQAAQKVALNVVRSMEKSIAKMEKKDQLRVAKELRKATKGLEDSELTEEDQAALENLDETLDQQEDASEETAAETVEVASDGAIKAMALTADTLTDAAKVSKSTLSKVQKADTNVKKVQLEQTKQQKQTVQTDQNQTNNKDKITSKEETKVKAEEKAKNEMKTNQQKLNEEQELQDQGKPEAEQESALTEKDSSSQSSVKDQERAGTQQKTSTEREKGNKSSSKSGGKSGGKDK